MGLNLNINSTLTKKKQGGIPFQSDLNLKITSRDKYDFVADIGTNAKILLPFYRKTTNGAALLIVDTTEALDIKTNDFNFIHRCRCMNNTKTAIIPIAGKGSSSTTKSGIYEFYGAITTGYLTARFITSEGAYLIESTTDYTDGSIYSLRLEINKTTSVAHFYINNVEVGTGTAFTGTFSAVIDEIEFMIGARSNSTGSAYTASISSDHSDTFIYNKLLTPTEATTIYNGGIVSGAVAHWPLTAKGYNDVSGNNFHLTQVGTNTTNLIAYGSMGSRQGLELGYTIYSKLNFEDVHVPFKDNGEELTSPVVPSGFTKNRNVAYNSFHNFYDSYVDFDGDDWDRSDTDIYNDLTRLVRGVDLSNKTYYLEANPKAWHISELNQLNLYNCKNTGYLSRTIVHFETNSISDRDSIVEILAYDTTTDANLPTILSYTGDNDIINSHSLTVEISTEKIKYINGDKVLKFSEGVAPTSTLYLSLDGGETYTKSLRVTDLSGYLSFAMIHDNGNITFAGYSKIYVSTDNLDTYSEITPKDIAGSNYVVPDTYQNFQPFTLDKSYPSSRPVLFGNYSTIDGYTAHIWSLETNGTVLKEVFRFGTSTIGGNVVAARHVHSINWNEFDSAWYIATGDNTDECHFIKATYSEGSYTFTKIATSDGAGLNKIVGLCYYDGYFYWASDSSTAANMGLFRCAYANIGDATKYERIFVSGFTCTSFSIDSNGYVVARVGIKGTIATSIDLVNFKLNKFDYSDPPITQTYRGHILLMPRDAGEWNLFDIYDDTEDLYNYKNKTNLLCKLIV
jgi:hypothetical protein